MPDAALSDDERQALLDLAADALLEGPRCYTADEVCRRAGIDRATADALWRAMGFPEVPDDEQAFTDRDLAAVQQAIALQRTGVIDAASVRAQTRVMSQALATIAAAHTDLAPPDERTPQRLGRFVSEVLPALDDLLVYLYRRHLLAAIERAVELRLDTGDHPVLAVGFADLVGFTRVANHLEEADLTALVEGFAQAAADIVADEGGRVVKMIGDEVMFTAADTVAAVRIAVRLVDEVGERDGRPALRAGVAAGPVVLRHGDVFGPPANLAHRLVEAARPGGVLVDESAHDALEGHDEIDLVRVHGIRRLRGFDRVRVWSARRRDRAAS